MRNLKVTPLHDSAASPEPLPIYVTGDERAIVSDIVTALQTAVSGDTTYTTAQTALLTCMNARRTRDLGNGAVFKRLGFLLMRLGEHEDMLDACQSRLTAGNAQLDPSTPSRRLVKRWQLWIPKSWEEPRRELLTIAGERGFGGTCLKKCFLETYRLSEDLDFTVEDAGQLDGAWACRASSLPFLLRSPRSRRFRPDVFPSGTHGREGTRLGGARVQGTSTT